MFRKAEEVKMVSSELVKGSIFSTAERSRVWYIPRIENVHGGIVQLIKDGNGIPVIHRMVHVCFKDKGGFVTVDVGCNSTAEHVCPLCRAVSEQVNKKDGEPVGESNSGNDKIKQKPYATIMFKRHLVYLIVASIEMHNGGAVLDEQSVPNCKLELIKMSTKKYNELFKQKLMQYGAGIYIGIDCQHGNSPVERMNSTSTTVIDRKQFAWNTSRLEYMVERALGSIDLCDVFDIAHELDITPIDILTSMGE